MLLVSRGHRIDVGEDEIHQIVLFYNDEVQRGLMSVGGGIIRGEFGVLLLTHASCSGYVLALQIDNQILGLQVQQLCSGQRAFGEDDAARAERSGMFACLLQTVQAEQASG